MKKEIWDERGERLLRAEEGEPICGEDFCDRCGDCLHCYGEESCIDGGKHRWIVYEEHSGEIMDKQFYDPKHHEWHWISNQVSIPIPDKDVLTVMRMLLIEKLKVRMFLMAKVFDGGKEIRVPLNYGKGDSNGR